MPLHKVFAPLVAVLILSFGTVSIAGTMGSNASNLEVVVQNQWQLPENPIDIVHSLDNKYVFILTRQHTVLIYTAQGELEGSIPVDAGVCAIDIAPRAEMLYLIDSEAKTFTAVSVDFIKTINISGSPFKGPANAPVTITLFTDFECPYCSKLEPILDQVLQRNPKTVKLVLKNLPLQFHKFADLSARAALAAGEQGKFWEFHDALFATKKLSKQAIEKIAAQLHLDLEKWKTDLNSPAIRQKINTDIHDAEKAGVTGTPTVFTNGRQTRDRSIQGIQQMIDNILLKK